MPRGHRVNCAIRVRLHLNPRRDRCEWVIDTRVTQRRDEGRRHGCLAIAVKLTPTVDRVADDGIESLRERHDQDVGFSKNYPNGTSS